ncbi:hypothetical protein RRSWK_05654 [Rhodopirellula sp. SWK7]|nr:hypothetical protein RRSWK_05654 [Rhodopirellula sp. SWK7]
MRSSGGRFVGSENKKRGENGALDGGPNGRSGGSCGRFYTTGASVQEAFVFGEFGRFREIGSFRGC